MQKEKSKDLFILLWVLNRMKTDNRAQKDTGSSLTCISNNNLMAFVISFNFFIFCVSTKLNYYLFSKTVSLTGRMKKALLFHHKVMWQKPKFSNKTAKFRRKNIGTIAVFNYWVKKTKNQERIKTVTQYHLETH